MSKAKSTAGAEGAAADTAAHSAPGSPLPESLQRSLASSGTCDHNKEPLAVVGTTLKLQPKLDTNESHALSMRQETDLDCMLLQDTTIDAAPQHLLQLLSHVNTAKSTQAELLLLLLYTSALESGFVMDQEHTKCCKAITELPTISTFHAKNLLCLTRQCPHYTKDAARLHFSLPLRLLVDVVAPQPKTLRVLLTAAVSGDFMIATLSPDATLSDVRGFSICLSIARYVLSTQAVDKPLYTRFRKLDELALQTREQLFVPMRNQQLAALGVEIYPSLLGLPADLYDNIFQYLNKNQRNIVANVNRLLRDCIKYSRIITSPQSTATSVIMLAS